MFKFCINSKKSISITQVILLTLALLFINLSILPTPSLGEDKIKLKIFSDLITGYEYEASIWYENTDANLQLSHFNLLIQYDSSGLEFNDAQAGDRLTVCNWDEFQFYQEDVDLIRISAIADIAATCNLENTTGNLAIMHFTVKDSLSEDCQMLPIQFYWEDCSDNAFYGLSPNTVYMENTVRGPYYNLLLTREEILPSYTGMPDSCLAEFSPSDYVERQIEFTSGTIPYGCTESWSTGDMNLNAIVAEPEDYFLYCDYFIYGSSVFLDYEQSAANSDINNDGQVLTTDDLLALFLWLIPVIDDPEQEDGDTAVFIQDIDYNTITFEYPDTLFSAQLRFIDTIIIKSMISDLTYEVLNLSSYNIFLLPSDIEGRTGLVPGTIMTYSGDGQLSEVSMCYDFDESEIPTRVVILSGTGCGDANYDQTVNVSDAVYIINYVFVGGSAPSNMDFADANCDGTVNVSDAVWIINYVFQGGFSPCDADGDGEHDC
jgi:Dockerin type I domain